MEDNDLKTDTVDLKDITFGHIEACKDCSGIECCGIVAEGGIIEPPYLTIKDIDQIEKVTGIQKENFTIEKTNPNTGSVVYFMKTLKDKGCIFFNGKDGKCEIYSLRPFDCKLFPIDCRSFKGENDNQEAYYWSQYKFKKCKLTKKDKSNFNKYKEASTLYLGEEIHDFATYPLPKMEEIGFKKLFKVEYDK